MAVPVARHGCAVILQVALAILRRLLYEKHMQRSCGDPMRVSQSAVYRKMHHRFPA